MAVRMELSRILIRELADVQMIELREVAGNPSEDEPPEGDSAGEGDGRGPSSGQQQPLTGGLEGGAASDEASLRTFPIVIGLVEAQAIERRLKGVVIKRPQTHDLLADVIRELGATIKSISVTDLNEHTFFAALNLRTADGRLISVDSRPSDAIALGVGANVPIYVAEHVLEAASKEEE